MAIGKTVGVHPSKGLVIRYKGILDIDDLYKSVKGWFGDYGYDYYEKENTEKKISSGDAIKIKMKAEREVDDYVMFEMQVDFVEIINVKKVKKGGYYGEARIIIRSIIHLDSNNNWKNIPFLFYLYNNIILKKKIWGHYWVNAYDEMMELNSLIKSKLGLIK
jgi:hypothetical protein